MIIIFNVIPLQIGMHFKSQSLDAFNFREPMMLVFTTALFGEDSFLGPP